MNRVLTRTVLPLAALVVMAAMGMRFFAGVDDLRSIPTIERPSLLVLAVVGMAATVLAYGVVWRQLITAIDRADVSPTTSMAIFVASWLARYVPGGVPYLAGTIVVGHRFGYGRVALGAAVVYQNLIIVAVSMTAAPLVLAVVAADRSAAFPWLVVSLLSGCALAVLPAQQVRSCLMRLSELVPRLRGLAGCHLRTPDVTTAAVVALIASLINGLSFALVLLAFVDLSLTEAIITAAAFNLAGAVGVAAVPVPGGLGVREAVLIALLQTVVPLEVATAAAVTARFLSIPADVLLGLAGVGWLARLGRAGESRIAVARDSAADDSSRAEASGVA
jgi:uncharacterized membrane protein YbhN (UPF0104 family)